MIVINTNQNIAWRHRTHSERCTPAVFLKMQSYIERQRLSKDNYIILKVNYNPIEGVATITDKLKFKLS